MFLVLEGFVPVLDEAQIHMAFFGKSLKSRKIVINQEATSSECPELRKRLDRIETNYSKLDEILEQLETQFSLDERLTSESDAEIETTKISRKKPR